MIGTRLAHYEIMAHLGSGGMGDSRPKTPRRHLSHHAPPELASQMNWGTETDLAVLLEFVLLLQFIWQRVFGDKSD